MATTIDAINKSGISRKLALAAQLQTIRDQANNGYKKSISGLQTTYQPLRDAQDFQNAKNIQATRENMASMGIANSGDLITAQVSNRVGNENALNSINTQQQGEKANFENLIAQANNTYNTNLTNGSADIDAQTLSQVVTQQNQDRDYEAQQQQIAYNKMMQDREYEAQQRQNAFNNNIETQRLALAIATSKGASSGSSGSSRSGSKSSNKPASKTTIKSEIRKEFDYQLKNNQGSKWLDAYGKDITDSLNDDGAYVTTLRNIYNKDINNTYKEKTKNRALENNMRPQY